MMNDKRKNYASSSATLTDGMEKTSITSSLGFGIDLDLLSQQQPLHGRTIGPKRRSTKGQWTPEQDEMLYRAVQRHHGKSWKMIECGSGVMDELPLVYSGVLGFDSWKLIHGNGLSAKYRTECFPGRSDAQCLHRWQKVLNPALVKGAWSKEEDELIIEMVHKHGPKKWATIAQGLAGRIGKQCRERWFNHLNPAINKEAWTQEEEIALIHAHQIYGNKWVELTKIFPGRSDNSIKNHWNSSVKKKLKSYSGSGLLASYPDLPILVSSTSTSQQNNHDVGFKEIPDTENSSECSSSALLISSQPECEMAKPVPVGGDFKKTDAVEKEAAYSHLPVYSNEYHGSIQEASFGVPKVHCEQFLPEATSSESLLEKAQEFEDDEVKQPAHTDSNDNREKKSSLGMKNLKYVATCLSCKSDSHSSETCMNFSPCSYPLFPTSTSDMFGISCCQSLTTVVPPSFFCLSNNVDIEDLSQSLQNSGPIAGLTIDVPYSSYPLPHVCEVRYSSHEHVEEQKEHQFKEGEKRGVENTIPNTTSCETPTGNLSFACEKKVESEKAFDPGILSLADEKKDGQPERFLDFGSLFYEPPRITSLGIPFVRCGIVSSDLQQAYSPLGIQNLLIPSSLCNLLDSSSLDNSPDDVLRHASKSFLCTPSIIKKRQRELLTPTVESKFDKKSGTYKNRGSFMTSLASVEACMDDVIGDAGAKRISSYSVEDVLNSLFDQKYKSGSKDIDDLGAKPCEEITYGQTFSPSDLQQKAEKYRSGATVLSDVDSDAKGPQCRGVLVERNKTNLESLSGYSSFISPSVCRRKHVHQSKVTSIQYQSSSKKLQVTLEKSTPSIDAELDNLNIFADTPSIKRGLFDTPSAWKSPWGLNSFLPGEDMTFEDIRYILSPGERSYDALGLMKQVSEQSAPVIADAEDILFNWGQKLDFGIDKYNSRNSSQENSGFTNEKQNSFSMPSNNRAKGRVLDFSGCTTPNENSRNMKVNDASGTSLILTSTSHLLKGCR